MGWDHLWPGCLSASAVLGNYPPDWEGPPSTSGLLLQISSGYWRWISQPCLLPYKVLELFLFGSLMPCCMFSSGLVWSFRQAPSAYHCKHRRFLLAGQESYSSASLTRIYLHKGSHFIEFKVWLQVSRQVNNHGIFLKWLNTSKFWVTFLCLCTELWES